jgi:hypothetical protein
MTRSTLASLALVVLASAGSTGCHRYRVRYGFYAPRAAVCVPVPPPPAEPAPPAAEETPPPQPLSQGPRPVVVHANVPGTTVIVVNPAPGGPPVVEGVEAPPPPVPPRPQPQESPSGWGDAD